MSEYNSELWNYPSITSHCHRRIHNPYILFTCTSFLVNNFNDVHWSFASLFDQIVSEMLFKLRSPHKSKCKYMNIFLYPLSWNNVAIWKKNELAAIVLIFEFTEISTHFNNFNKEFQIALIFNSKILNEWLPLCFFYRTSSRNWFDYWILHLLLSEQKLLLSSMKLSKTTMISC